MSTGVAQVPARLPQLLKGGNDRARRAALQDPDELGPLPVRHDPQDAEGAGPRRPDRRHVQRRVEEGRAQRRAGV